MEGRNIKIGIRGIVRNTPGTIGQDGELEEMINLRFKDGAIRPIANRTEFADVTGYTSIYIHSNAGYKHVLGIASSNLYYIGDITSGVYAPKAIAVFICAVTGTPTFTQIGNVVNILDTEGLKYAIWYDSAYVFINTAFDGAQTDTSLGPVGRVDFKVDGRTQDGERLYRVFQSDLLFSYSSQAEATAGLAARREAAKGMLLKAEASLTKSGYLTGFILACAVVELYDGSYILHGNPILLGQPFDANTRYSILKGSTTYDYLENKIMFTAPSYFTGSVPESGYWETYPTESSAWIYNYFPDIADYDPGTPAYNFCEWRYVEKDTVGIKTRTLSNKLSFKINNSIPESVRPLVKSLSIFITPQVKGYDYESIDHINADLLVYGYTDFFTGKPKTNAEIIKELMAQPNFYKVHEVPFDGIVAGGWLNVDLENKLGDLLVTNEALPIDPLSHHILKPSSQFVYNSKLHAANYSTLLSRGWPLPYFKPSQGVGQFSATEISPISGFSKALTYVEVSIKTESGMSKVVRYNIPSTQLDVFSLGGLISYPDSRANKIKIRREYKGYPPVTERGVCWNTSGSPTVLDGKAVIGDGTGTFGQNITGLTRNTTYYVRSYAMADGVANYGEEKSFTTDDGIAVFTTKLPDPMASVAYTGGDITTDGGSPITARGVCWGTTTAPTTSGDKTVDGSGTGEFFSEITGLDPSTTYYVRAYVVNEFGTHYGDEYSFETLSGAVDITIGDAYDIAPSMAKIAITVAEGGGSLEFPHGGVCWSTSPNPTIENDKTEDFDDFGAFISQMSAMSPGATYYVRGYAVNEFGVTYTPQKTFVTLTGVLDVVTLDIDPLYVGDTWAHVRGEVEDNYGGGVSEFGICYSLSNTVPTIADSKIIGTGSFELFDCLISGLIPDMGNYYARAYAKNDIGTFYGAVKTFYTTP